jgi:hypothetical protein
MPSVCPTYWVRLDNHLELEVASKTPWDNRNYSKELQRDLLVRAGVRFEFSSVN